MTNYSIGGSSGTTGLSQLTATAPGDKIPVVDISDTTTAPAGSAGSAKYMTVATLAGLVSATLYPPVDTTGAAGAALIEAARSALSGSPGVIRLAATAPWDVEEGIIAAFVTGQYIDAPGCIIRARGSGDLFNWSDSSTYDTRTASGGGITGFPVIDGTNTTGTSNGVHAGDILQLKFYATVQNFTAGTGSRCFKFDNRWAIAEQMQGIIRADNGDAGVEFTQTPAVGNTFCFGSFERANLSIFLNQGDAANDGIVLSAGTYMDNSVLTVGGNFGGSATALTSAAFRLTGSTPTGSQDGPAGTIGSNMNNMTMNVGVECEANTHTPATFVVDAGSGCFAGNLFGSLHFGAAGNTFTSTSAVISFFGNTDGDPGIVAQTGQSFLFQGLLGLGTFAAATVPASNATLTPTASFLQVAPAGTVTGIKLAAGTWDGQPFIIANTSANLITLASSGSGSATNSDTIVTHTAAIYVWSVNTSLWYRVK